MGHQIWRDGYCDAVWNEGVGSRKQMVKADLCGKPDAEWTVEGGARKKAVKPSQRKVMAQWAKKNE